MTALMRNGRDRRLGEPVRGHAILERVLLFGTRSADYIRASGHSGCIATEATLQATTEAEYVTAPERFADSQIPLAPRAPSTKFAVMQYASSFNDVIGCGPRMRETHETARIPCSGCRSIVRSALRYRLQCSAWRMTLSINGGDFRCWPLTTGRLFRDDRR